MMKLSTNTVEVLKNFASINPNILIRAGDSISTISAGKNIFAKAKIQETFDREFAIYDLNSFLATLSLANNADIQFDNEFLQVEIDSGTMQYYYSDPSVIQAAPDKEIQVDNYFQFTLTKEALKTIFSTASVSQATMFSVIGNGTNVSIVVGDPKTPSSNNYQKTIAASTKVFKAHLPIDSLKIMNDTYTVTVSEKKFIYLEGTNGSSRYWLALDKDSEF
jgi:hypothetical protein